MLLPCARCGESLPAAAQFCKGCGNPVAAAPPPPALRLSIDTGAMRLFMAGTRCALRLRVDGPGDLIEARVHAQLADGERLAPARASGTPLQDALLTLWLVPPLAGFYELRGLVCAVTPGGEQVYARFDGLQFRVGAPGEGPRVSVVNIDQRSARVVDNSRTSFAPVDDGPDRGGLVSGGDWHEVPLATIAAAAAAALFPEAVSAAELQRAEQRVSSPARAPASGAASFKGFKIRTERNSYEAVRVLAQGDLATVYEGRRDSDGALVAVKLVEDEADNDLMAAEIATLALLSAEDSPQRKHLPAVLDRFHTADHRLGTIFEHLDGFDLREVRRRLPDGLPQRHLIWVMRRCLSVLGWAHSRGVLHGNVEPAHILIRPGDHNVWLIDWCYAIVNPAQTGQGFRCLNEDYSPPEAAARQPPLPSSDLYSLGKSMIYLAGGDPLQRTLPAELDERLQRFLQYCVLDSALTRAGDAWEAYRQMDRLRADIFGPHRFEELYL